MDPLNEALSDYLAARKELDSINALRAEPIQRMDTALRKVIDAAFNDAGIERPPTNGSVRFLVAGRLVEIWNKLNKPFACEIGREPIRKF